MGFNTTVVVYNDSLHAIEKDPKFGKKLVDAIMSLHNRDSSTTDRSPSAGYHCNAAFVVETHHADQMVAVLVGGNMGQELGYAGGYTLDVDKEEDKIQAIRNLAASVGYDLRKCPTKRKVKE